MQLSWSWDVGGTGDLCVPNDPSKLFVLWARVWCTEPSGPVHARAVCVLGACVSTRRPGLSPVRKVRRKVAELECGSLQIHTGPQRIAQKRPMSGAPRHRSDRWQWSWGESSTTVPPPRKRRTEHFQGATLHRLPGDVTTRHRVHHVGAVHASSCHSQATHRSNARARA